MLKDLKGKVMNAALKSLREQISEKIGSIRDPDAGEFPTVVIRGGSIADLTIHVEGTPKLIALVNERLGLDGHMSSEQIAPEAPPQAFLSYTSDDLPLARRVAEFLQSNGIDTWWDRWCVSAGESLRQKIDDGISECTHFLVLLTPQSITKPWVNQEMDAGLVRKLSDQCKFLPIRFELPASKLPPLLSGMHSPSITNDDDLSQLVNDIFGVSRKPPLGAPPSAVKSNADKRTGYSAAATSVAGYFVEHSKHGHFGDPIVTAQKLATDLGLTREDTSDALHELSAFLKRSGDHVMPYGALFAEFDRHWKPWNVADDALRLAADIINDPAFPSACEEIATRYGWQPRRLNPVAHYFLERGIIVDYQGIGTAPWAVFRIVGNEQMRRFVKSRS